MNQQVAQHLDNLAEITRFASRYAFNSADELTPEQFIADQFLRRCTELAEDSSSLIRNGHDLSAAILQRAAEERVAILGYLNEHNQFKEFQDFSMAQEYQTLQHITSEPRTGQVTRQAAERRKAEIRHSMGGEPGKPANYWKRPTHREALQSISQGHPNTNLVHIANYEIPSSAAHIRHNDNEPTGIPAQAMAAQVTSNAAAITILALLIAGNEDALLKFKPLLTRLFPDHADIDTERS